MTRLIVVGAGLSGATLARALADAGRPVTVVEARPHVAGDCHTERDAATGVMVHRYGPHIFHTDDAGVVAFVTRFARFRPYRHRVRAALRGAVYPLPVNLATINQFFGRALRPDEARAFIAGLAEPGPCPPESFEDQALEMIGRDLYDAFFRDYTRKQWGVAPDALPAAILKRLPLRFSYDDAYFTHRFQAIPEDGYTAMVTAMLDHPLVGLELNTRLARTAVPAGTHVFCSGPVDGWFDHCHGRLGYRTLDFEHFTAPGDWQGCAVMNWPGPDVPWTRITEHKHFAPWERHAASYCSRETPRACGPGDVPYYPLRLLHEKAMLGRYVALARETPGVTFLGRLGTYRYLDMDVCVREALETAQMMIEQGSERMPAFVHAPL